MHLLNLALATLLLAGAGSAQLTPNDVLVDGQLVRQASGRSYAARPGLLSLRLLDPSADVQQVLARASLSDARLSGLTLQRSNRLGIADLSFPAERGHAQVIDALLGTGLVEFAEPAFVGEYAGKPDDLFFDSQWNLHNEGQAGGTVGADVRALDAWAIEDGDPSVIVAVLDSGSDWTAADLAASIWSNPGETLNGLDDDNNGFVDDVRGWDFDGGDNDPSGTFSHGTNVASVIGARGNNGLEIAGVAGGAVDGAGCSVMPLNVGSSAPNSDVVDDAILYAIDAGARVITLSLTLPPDQAVADALQAAHVAGVFVDCASGNAGGTIGFPANVPTVMAVGATNDMDEVPAFSNFGPELEIVAPGEAIPVLDIGGGTVTNTGTSFSAPHVGAAAGLAFSANPALTHTDVRRLLRESARDIGASLEKGGAGCLDLAALLGLVEGLTPPLTSALQAYGEGLPGFGDQTPRAGSEGGRPTLGNGAFRLTLDEARPLAAAYLLIGFADAALPFAQGELLVDLSPPSKVVPHATDANGRATQLARIADDPGLIGLEVFVQWVVEDSDAPAGLSLSRGLRIGIGE